MEYACLMGENMCRRPFEALRNRLVACASNTTYLLIMVAIHDFSSKRADKYMYSCMCICFIKLDVKKYK